MSPAFVCIVGIATVFAGLIAIIALCKLMSVICSLFPEKKAEPAISPAQQPRKSTPGANGEVNLQFHLLSNRENLLPVQMVRPLQTKKKLLPEFAR